MRGGKFPEGTVGEKRNQRGNALKVIIKGDPFSMRGVMGGWGAGRPFWDW